MARTTPLPIQPKELKAVILSHGWYALKPVYANTAPPYLKIPFNVPQGKGIAEIICRDGRCFWRAAAGSRQASLYAVNTCLSLDIDTAPFYRETKKNPAWRWIPRKRLGRFLRSCTLFEDCCKAVFATNTTFDRTIAMTESFIELCGSDAAGHRVFPGPEQVYRKKEHTLQKKTGCGYRAGYILKLAKTARNNPRLFSADGWKALSGVQFYEELKKLPGLGPASLNYLAMIYGKPAGFTIDAYVQRRCRDLWGVDKAGIKGFLQERYRDANGYGPLLLWFELTGHWHMRDSDSDNRTW